jgi:hypothetical protein
MKIKYQMPLCSQKCLYHHLFPGELRIMNSDIPNYFSGRSKDDPEIYSFKNDESC